jgi:hypothetical protein
MTSAVATDRIRTLVERAQQLPHGQRARYAAGCRCDYCRKANSDYERARLAARKTGDWNGLVDATEARMHLMKLRQRGVGKLAVAAATDIAKSMLQQIINGTRTQIRARTARKILAVTPAMASDHATVPAGATWQRIRALMEEGYTRAQIRAALGIQGRAIQFGKRRVLVATAAKVERVHRRLTE